MCIRDRDYITTASTGNATDFGDASSGSQGCRGLSSSTRGVYALGYVNPASNNTIEYITIASTGDATDFGNLVGSSNNTKTPLSNNTRGIWAGGAPTRVATIDFVTIATTANAADFGDLTAVRNEGAGMSDSHGGLQT